MQKVSPRVESVEGPHLRAGGDHAKDTASKMQQLYILDNVQYTLLQNYIKYMQSLERRSDILGNQLSDDEGLQNIISKAIKLINVGFAEDNI